MNKLFTSLIIFLGLFTGPLSLASDITIDNAWIREAPPVSKVQAAYMKIYNKSDKDISLVSATSPYFSHIEFHRTEISKGVMRMLHEKTLIIPANGEKHLQPDGTHMMLFNPRKSLKAGDKVNFTLTFSKQKEIELMLVVKNPSRSMERSHRCGGH